jgi:hypothetical protein
MRCLECYRNITWGWIACVGEWLSWWLCKTVWVNLSDWVGIGLDDLMLNKLDAPSPLSCRSCHREILPEVLQRAGFWIAEKVSLSRLDGRVSERSTFGSKYWMDSRCLVIFSRWTYVHLKLVLHQFTRNALAGHLNTTISPMLCTSLISVSEFLSSHYYTYKLTSSLQILLTDPLYLSCCWESTPLDWVLSKGSDVMLESVTLLGRLKQSSSGFIWYWFCTRSHQMFTVQTKKGRST